MKKKIKIEVEIDINSNNKELCGKQCEFLDPVNNYCTLFDEFLDTYNNGMYIDRALKCLEADSTNEGENK